MGHARGARAVRQAKSEPQVEAQIAMERSKSVYWKMQKSATWNARVGIC